MNQRKQDSRSVWMKRLRKSQIFYCRITLKLSHVCVAYRALLCFNTFTKLKLEMIYFTELQQRNSFFPCQKNCENSGKRRKVYGMTLGESEVAHNGTLTKILLLNWSLTQLHSVWAVEIERVKSDHFCTYSAWNLKPGTFCMKGSGVA